MFKFQASTFHLASRRVACAGKARLLIGRFLKLGCFLVIGFVAACGPGPGAFNRPAIQSENAGDRILAIKAAAETGDRSAVPLLVDRLEDEDEAVRMFAIIALERITGERFGYDYSKPPFERAAAVEYWRDYVRQRRHVRTAAVNQANRAAETAEPAAATTTDSD
jgi:hypothetical protein